MRELGSPGSTRPSAPRRRRGRARRSALGRRHVRGVRLRDGSPPTPSSRGGRRSTSPRSSAALDRHAAASWKAKRAADRYPRACLWALRAPGVFGAVAGLLRGELAHPSEARRIARPALRGLSRLAGSPVARLSAAQPCAWSKVEASRASTLPTTPFFTSCTTTVTFLSARPPVGVVVTMYVSTR